jgi:hypothetical protein
VVGKAARRAAALAVAVLAIALVCAAAAQARGTVDETLTLFFGGDGTGKVTISPPGLTCNANCRATVAQGSTVTMTATPDPGSGVDSWSSNVCAEQGSALEYHGTTCTVTMTSSKSVSIYFEKVQLNVFFGGDGTGSVTSAPAGVDCKENCKATFAPGTKVVLTAKPDADSGMDSWSSNVCAEQGSKTEYHGLVCTITMDRDKSISVYFEKVQLNVFFGQPNQGTVTSSPPGIDCSENCKGTFPKGVTVKLTAQPKAGFTIDSWSSNVCSEQGNKQSYNGTTCTTLMDRDKSFSIYFKAGSAGGTIGSSSPPPPPKPGVAVNVEADSGVILVKVPGSAAFATLQGGAQVPVGSTVDATRGKMGLTSSGGASDFSKGAFKVTEPKGVGGARVTALALTGGNFGACPKKVKRKTAGVSSTSAAAPKVIRQLVGNGKGRFRTTGRLASATVRGTGWTIQDRCDGTLVKVTKGVVAVTNLKTHKVVVVRAGKTYLAKS